MRQRTRDPQAGVSGFLLKDAPLAQIIEAIHKVVDGEPILSPRITRRLMDRAAAGSGVCEQAQASLAALSVREYEVVVAVAKEQTSAEIATELYMSVATVKAHISRILVKLSLGNRTQIALLGHDAGLA
jgi:DNA-binding NarL/FixJ family response regulator